MLLICIDMIGATQRCSSVRYKLKLIQEGLIMMNLYLRMRMRNLQRMQLQGITKQLNLKIIQKIRLDKVRKTFKMLILNRIFWLSKEAYLILETTKMVVFKIHLFHFCKLIDQKVLSRCWLKMRFNIWSICLSKNNSNFGKKNRFSLIFIGIASLRLGSSPDRWQILITFNCSDTCMSRQENIVYIYVTELNNCILL